jgi:hypothetical protein
MTGALKFNVAVSSKMSFQKISVPPNKKRGRGGVRVATKENEKIVLYELIWNDVTEGEKGFDAFRDFAKIAK